MLGSKCHSLWSHHPHSCRVMGCDDSDMAVFTDTATWIWMKGKQPVTTWNMLIKEEKFPSLPTQCVVWGINQKGKKIRDIFTFQIYCISKAPLSVRYASLRAGRQRITQDEMTQVTNRLLRNSISLETHKRASEQRYSQLERDVGLQCCSGLHMRHILYHMGKEWQCSV